MSQVPDFFCISYLETFLSSFWGILFETSKQQAKPTWMRRKVRVSHEDHEELIKTLVLLSNTMTVTVNTQERQRLALLYMTKAKRWTRHRMFNILTKASSLKQCVKQHMSLQHAPERRIYEVKLKPIAKIIQFYFSRLYLSNRWWCRCFTCWVTAERDDTFKTARSILF